VDYRGVKALQGNLKDLNRKNHDKLLRVLKKRGFTAPLLLWRDPKDGVLYLLDGTQRQRTMLAGNMNDEGSYCVPYVLIPGASAKEAKEQLLELTSSYGKLTIEGLEEFAFDMKLEDLDVAFDAIDLDKYLDSDPLITDDKDGDVEQAKTPSNGAKVKRYTSDQLRQLAKDYHPHIEETLVEFVDWLDQHGS
jgi:hypothetical protein